MSEYLMAGQLSERDRLQLQARVWEPAGAHLLEQLGPGNGLRVADVGCGCLGWLRILSEWVGPNGHVVGTDVDDGLLESARTFVETESLANVEIVRDDLFASELPERSFDLVHARFQIAPLGRAAEQLDAYLKMVAPGGRIVLEDPDSSSWHFNPSAPALERLIALVLDAFRAAGGDFDAGRHEAGYLRASGLEPQMRAEVHALAPGHPYLRLPLQFATSLEPRLLQQIDAGELARVREAAEAELLEPGRWGTTFTVVQTWATV
jgi:SAM-dependent methyltransferase